MIACIQNAALLLNVPELEQTILCSRYKQGLIISSDWMLEDNSSELGDRLIMAKELKLSSVRNQIVNYDVGVIRTTGHLSVIIEEFNSCHRRSMEGELVNLLNHVLLLLELKPIYED